MPNCSSTLEREISLDEFRALFRRHPGAVCVITLMTPEGPRGFTATSVISVSAEPPMLAFSIIKGSSSYKSILARPQLAVHFLDHTQMPIAQQFATPNVDRFAGLETFSHDGEVPILAAVSTWAAGKVATITELSSSSLVTVGIERSSVGDAQNSLIYRDREYGSLSAE